MTTILIESLDLSEAQIDDGQRALKNVILIRAGTTLNRRHYSEDILKKSAPLFEGIKAYDSHKIGVARQVSEITGWYSNIRYENGAIRGDRFFSRTRAGQDVFAIAEDIVKGRAPRSLAGLSINAVGTGKIKKFDDGEALNVESITGATSVDDVTVPAAGGTYLTASTNGDELTSTILDALTFEEFFNARPDYIKRIQNEMKTARQEDALKAAKAEAEKHLNALTEAQEQLAALQTGREAATAELAEARRELALEKAFRKAGLPAVAEENLREHMAGKPVEEWAGIIARKRDELKALGLEKRVAVTGAGQQIAPVVIPTAKRDPMTEARAQIAGASSPEDLQRILENMRI